MHVGLTCPSTCCALHPPASEASQGAPPPTSFSPAPSTRRRSTPTCSTAHYCPAPVDVDKTDELCAVVAIRGRMSISQGTGLLSVAWPPKTVKGLGPPGSAKLADPYTESGERRASVLIAWVGFCKTLIMGSNPIVASSRLLKNTAQKANP